VSDSVCTHDLVTPEVVARSYTPFEVALVIFALAVGGFAIGTGEFAVMGVLPDIASTFSVTTPQAGYVISSYALGVVIGAPLIATLAARLTRRSLLLGLMAVFATGNILSAFAPGFASFTALRFLTGLPHGAYFGIAALVSASLVPLNKRARAVGWMMLGLTVATLAGTPLMSLFGQLLNWRVVFFGVGLIGLVCMALCFIYLPHDRVSEGASIKRELVAFTHAQVWLTLIIAATGFGGMFSVFSYIAATSLEVAHMQPGWIPVIMILFGIGMNLGNIVGSRLADMSLMGTIGGMLVFNMVIMTMFGLTAANPYMLCLSVVLVGCTFAAGPAVQTRLMDVASDGQALAAASMHSAFNVANALGAWFGGLVIAYGFGYAATGYVGAAMSAFGMVVFAVSYWLERSASRLAA
jgi:MFS transporter, DHA1 family, inner membrane transport protein